GREGLTPRSPRVSTRDPGVTNTVARCLRRGVRQLVSPSRGCVEGARATRARARGPSRGGGLLTRYLAPRTGPWSFLRCNSMLRTRCLTPPRGAPPRDVIESRAGALRTLPGIESRRFVGQEARETGHLGTWDDCRFAGRVRRADWFGRASAEGLAARGSLMNE